MSRFHELSVADIVPEGEDAVAVSFDVPSELVEAFRFRPGQFLTLETDLEGAPVRRSYSIASKPGDPLRVGIRRVDGGAFSSFACDRLAVGDVLQVMPPEGRFTAGDETEVLLIAAGSGITPMVAIASERLAAGARVTLVYGNRGSDTIMFRRDLEALKDRYLDRFSVMHVLSRERPDVPLFAGRIDAERLRALTAAGLIDPPSADGVFLCGPGGMIETAEAVLAQMGVSRDRCHAERFSTDGTPIRASARAESAARAGVQVDILLDGVSRGFRLEEGDASLVEAAARQGLDLPYSCKGGMCCTCRCRIVNGSAEMAVNYSLEPWETEAGFTLACQARPTSERLVLDFDAS